VTALIVLLAAYGLFTLWLFRKSEQSIEQAHARIAELEQQRQSDAEQIAEMFNKEQFNQAEIMHLNGRLHDTVADLDEACAWIRRADGLPVKALADLEVEESPIFDQLMSDWLRPALPAPKTPRPPLALPSGHFLVDRTILPADDPDDPVAGTKYWAEPLPAGTNGTRP